MYQSQSKICERLPLYPEEKKITAADAMLAINSDVSVNSILILCIGIDFVFPDFNVIAFFITALTKWWISPLFGFVVKQSLKYMYLYFAYFAVTQSLAIATDSSNFLLGAASTIKLQNEMMNISWL